MGDVSASDTTLFQHNEKWWLFTYMRDGVFSRSEAETPEGTLRHDLFLFYAADLFAGAWISHPMNPIISDPQRARPAGRIIESDGRMYRPSQDCFKSYGRAVKINEITVLNEREYQEREVRTIESDSGTGVKAVHTYSRTGALTVIDGTREVYSLRLHRVLGRLKRTWRGVQRWNSL
jgi:hypothetical protein